MTKEPETAAPAPGRLRLLCVGTGRDGTTSVAEMVQQLFDHAGAGGRVEHEYQSTEMADRFCKYRETEDPLLLSQLQGMIATCPFECLVGGGYAALLPLFIEHYGRELTVVHIRRRDRTACVRSLKRNCELFPGSYWYYTEASQITHKRPAAFHFGEMTREGWDQLPLDEKLGWHYDNTHRLIAACKEDVDTYAEIATEELDTEATRRTLARLVLGSEAFLPAPSHLNLHFFESDMLPADARQKAHWLLQWLDLAKLASDEAYFLEYALRRAFKWNEIQGDTSGHLGSMDETVAFLMRAERILQSGLDDVAAYRAKLARMIAGDAAPDPADHDATAASRVRIGRWGPSPVHSAVALNGRLDTVVGLFGGGGVDPNLYLSAGVDGGAIFFSNNAEVAKLSQEGAFDAREYRIGGATVISPQGDLSTSGFCADQSYVYEAPAANFVIALGGNTQRLLLDPATPLEAGTVIMPQSPADGQIVKILSSQTIAALRVQANAGQTVNGWLAALERDSALAWIYRAANATWYRDQ